MFDRPDNAPRMIRRVRCRAGPLAGIAALAVSLATASSRHVAAGEPVPLRIGGTGMALAAMRQIGDAFAAAQPRRR